MQRIVILIISVLFVATITDNGMAQKCKTKWLDGTWTGSGYQKNALSENTWPIQLTYDYESGSFLIDYKLFPCSGYWELQSASRHKAEFVEHINEGKDRCMDENVIIVTRISDEYISVSYFAPGIISGVLAFSTLQKKE